jgi:diaminohydroxyphosphoribosylaminopyrimidine deaminase / 5-amino-6-(5-phosphoribosylamino)uracil reductase
MNDEFYIKRCFELAKKGMGLVNPNPMVGAVLVKDGKILAEGFHSHYGAPHAERNLFDGYSGDTTGATLYVNLEPCSHTKKQTPPCAPLVVEKKIKRLVISNIDPNPQVAGSGLDFIKSHKIEVTTGVLSEEGEKLNEVFFHWIKQQTPFIHLKSALTLDGKIALSNGESQWLTGETARLDSHIARAGASAILIGAETLRADNPSLTVRTGDSSYQPKRLIFTHSGKLDFNYKVFTDEHRDKTFIVTDSDMAFPWPGERVIRLQKTTDFDWPGFYEFCLNQKISSLFIEGGRSLFELFLKAQKVHRVSFYYTPRIMGEGMNVTPFSLSSKLDLMPKLINPELIHLGQDFKVTGRVLFPLAQ